MRIVFMGTPALAVDSLEALRQEHEVVLVVTQPDKPAGRGGQLTAPPVKAHAEAHGIPVAQPLKARDPEFVAQLAEYKPDGIAVVAYGQILPRAILEMPTKGCINLHFSLLPRWRGAAPVQHAILAGDTVTGITTQWMAEKLDAGDIAQQETIAILPEETSGDLLTRLTPLGAKMLADTMRQLENGTAARVPQDEAGVTFAPTIKKEHGAIDWTQPSAVLVNRVRGYNPWPTATAEFRGETLRVWRAQAVEGSGEPGTIIGVGADGVVVATGEDALRLVEIQAPGRRKMGSDEWARGVRIVAGEKFEARAAA